MKLLKLSGLPVAFFFLAVCFRATAPAYADGLSIVPTFGISITDNPDAAQIEGAINAAITTMDGLFSNSVMVPVFFTYNPAGGGNLESTSQQYYDVPYSTYVSLLRADSRANPSNHVLASALTNLPKGNDADGSKDLMVAGNLLTMLGIPAAANSIININSSQPFAFSRPVPSNQFDAIGGIEHELDEVLGGGGGGSTLNFGSSCDSFPTGPFCNKVGPTDLYRYSSPNNPSFTRSSSASAYLSVNGGYSKIVQFNQFFNGDYGDFAPPGAGAGQLIQNAFNSTGQYEAYTSSSPEFLMLESIGWNASSATATPEPGSLVLLVMGLLGTAVVRGAKSKPGRQKKSFRPKNPELGPFPSLTRKACLIHSSFIDSCNSLIPLG